MARAPHRVWLDRHVPFAQLRPALDGLGYQGRTQSVIWSALSA